jgi:hypothetical protein
MAAKKSQVAAGDALLVILHLRRAYYGSSDTAQPRGDDRSPIAGI